MRIYISSIHVMPEMVSFFFFLMDTAPTEIYPFPLPDALPISAAPAAGVPPPRDVVARAAAAKAPARRDRLNPAVEDEARELRVEVAPELALGLAALDDPL